MQKEQLKILINIYMKNDTFQRSWINNEFNEA